MQKFPRELVQSWIPKSASLSDELLTEAKAYPVFIFLGKDEVISPQSIPPYSFFHLLIPQVGLTAESTALTCFVASMNLETTEISNELNRILGLNFQAGEFTGEIGERDAGSFSVQSVNLASGLTLNTSGISLAYQKEGEFQPVTQFPGLFSTLQLLGSSYSIQKDQEIREFSWNFRLGSAGIAPITGKLMLDQWGNKTPSELPLNPLGDEGGDFLISCEWVISTEG